MLKKEIRQQERLISKNLVINAELLETKNNHRKKATAFCEVLHSMMVYRL